MKKLVSLALAAVLLLAVAGCGNTTPSTPSGSSTAPSMPSAPTTSAPSDTPAVDAPPPAEWPQFMSMGTASNGGAAYIVGNILCQLLTDKAPTTATGQVTTGGGQSIQLMRSGEYELAMADSYSVYQAIESTGTFEGEPSYSGLRAIGVLYTQYWEQMVAVNSGITSIKELEGKTCVVGGPGSGTEATTRTVYEAHGIDIDNDIQGEFVGYAPGVELMQNRQADAMSGICPIPFATFNELAVAGVAQIISLDDDAIAKLVAENPAMSADVVPAGTYPNQTEDAKCVSFPYMLLVDESMDESLAYEITKVIQENLAYLEGQSSTLTGIDMAKSLEDIENLTAIQLHPGAIKYYESVGAM